MEGRWILAKGGLMAILSVFLVTVWLCNPVSAATEEEIEQAISDGLEWLVSKQSPDGYFGQQYDYALAAKTSFAVLKLEEYALEKGYESPFDPDYQYAQNVEDGLNYIFSRATLLDTDGDGTEDALFFGEHLVYETSITMMAIGASQSPDRTVPALGTPIDGWTYKKVEEYALNYLIYTQQPNGGWGYHHGMLWSDNSNTGYATLGLMYAQNKFGLTIPEVVTDGITNWVDFIQCDDNGGSGYTSPCDWVNILKTGNLLYEMAIVGETANSASAKAAIGYIENHWNDASWDPGWMGSGDRPEFQATYTMMKGFEAMDINEIEVSGSKIDWFDQVSTAIVESQNTDGSWSPTTWGDSLLSTEWALLTLEKTVEVPVIKVSVDIKPGSCPNTITSWIYTAKEAMPDDISAIRAITVAVLGTEKFDVKTIDPSSIKISREGIAATVSPIRYGYKDVATPFTGELCDCHKLGADRKMDLYLVFDEQKVIDTLNLQNAENVRLAITGNLNMDNKGTPIRGEDCVSVLASKENQEANKKPPVD